MQKSLIKSIISYILSFVLFLALTGLTICLCVKATWLNQQFALSKINEHRYPQATYNIILNDYESIGIPSGIPVEVFEQALDIGIVSQDIEKSIQNLYDNQPFSVNTDILRESLKNAFVLYAESIDADITEDSVKEALESLEDYCVAKYESLVQFPFATQLSPYITRIIKFINPILTVLIITIITCMAGIILIKRVMAIRYICSSIVGGGLACLIPCVTALVYAPYNRLNLGVEALYRFLTNFIESGIKVILTIGSCMIIVGIIVIISMVLFKIGYRPKA